jgi:hypothetical protein
MYPGTFEMMKSLLLSNVDDGRCFSSQTRRHDVSRQVSNSVNGESGDCFFSITHLELFFFKRNGCSHVLCLNDIIPSPRGKSIFSACFRELTDMKTWER